MQLLKNIRRMLRPCTLLATASSFIFLSSCANDPSPVRSSQPARLSASPAQLAVETPQSPAPIPSPAKTLAADLPITPKPIPPKPLPIPPTTEPEVAIRIETLALNQVVIINHAGGRLQISPEHPSANEQNWTANAPIEIRAQGDGWRVTSANKTGTPSVTHEFPAGELTIQSLNSDTRPIQWNQREWPGKLRVVRTPNNVDLVMDVKMDSYLPGVIAKELYPSWCDAAYHAQAIAARSFAVVEEARWEGRRHYDMVAGQQSQAWIGATENRKALSAVRDTRGQVLVHDGLVVPAYYSSACGGRPANALGVLTDNPFHNIDCVSTGNVSARRTSCCETTSVATWKASIALTKVQTRLQAWGSANGRADLASLQLPTSIEVVDKNAAGRPEQFRIQTRKGGSVLIESEDFRRAINAAGDSKSSMRSCDCSIRIAGGNAEFSGRGFGHGVGLCQHGAQEMGRKGRTYQEILARYYPQSMIVQAWK